MPTIRSLLPKIVLVAGLATALPVSAAAIYGTLTDDDGPMRAVTVRLVCGTAESAGQTNDSGHYSLSIAVGGTCTLSVGDQSAEVILGDEPARYNFYAPPSGGLRQL